MRSVRISWKDARAIVSDLEAWNVHGRGLSRGAHVALDNLRSSLAPKKFVKASRARKAAKKKTKKEETAEIRAAVMKRADGMCECGCGCPLSGTAFNGIAELDHFFPKGRTKQSIRTCWALRRACHQAKTLNHPSPDSWLARFIRHCERNGYPVEGSIALRRLDALALSRQSTERAG